MGTPSSQAHVKEGLFSLFLFQQQLTHVDTVFIRQTRSAIGRRAYRSIGRHLLSLSPALLSLLLKMRRLSQPPSPPKREAVCASAAISRSARVVLIRYISYLLNVIPKGRPRRHHPTHRTTILDSSTPKSGSMLRPSRP